MMGTQNGVPSGMCFLLVEQLEIVVASWSHSLRSAVSGKVTT